MQTAEGDLKMLETRTSDSPFAEAAAWLAARPVGATLVEYLQRLPTDEAEQLLADVQQIKRLTAAEGNSKVRINDIEKKGLTIGSAGLLGTSIIGGEFFSPLVGLIVGGLFAFTAWRHTSSARRCEQRLQNNAWVKRNALLSSIRERYKAEYYESDDRFLSLSEIRARQSRINRGIEANSTALAEIQHGLKLASEAGVDISHMHAGMRHTTVIGGLPTVELVADPETERLFREMCRHGLKEYTLEAILYKHRKELPVDERTIDIIAHRLHPKA